MQTGTLCDPAGTRQAAPEPGEVRMRLRYGFNAGTHGPFAGAGIVRISASAADWAGFARLAQSALDAGVRPMVGFRDLDRPYDEPSGAKRFAERCAEFVKACLERWGADSVGQWYWAIGNKPNSEWDSGGLTFDQYRRFYEESATAILSTLGSRTVGGPAADGFQPFWFDWLWRFVHEIDPALIGFVSWHLYGDWREHGAWGAPADDKVFRGLILSRTPEYEVRARAVARLLKGSAILNVCDEWNAHAHWDPQVSGPFNQTAFGAAYRASALVHLMRGGADMELFAGAPYEDGVKRLCAEHVRLGDWLSFPPPPDADLDVVMARGADGRCGALVVHRRPEPAAYPFELTGCRRLLKLDGNRVTEAPFRGMLSFEGYGVAVVTNGQGGRP